MSAGSALFAQIGNDSTVSALIGASNSARIYPDHCPQPLAGSIPYIVYEISGGDKARTYTDDGGLHSSTGTINCYADTYAGSAALADAVTASLDSKKGTWGGNTVLGAFIEDGGEPVEDTGDQGEQRLLYVKELQFLIWIQP